MNRMERRTARGGFTLLELLLVMGLIFTLASVVAPRFSDYIPALRVQKSADRLFAWAQKARADAATTGVRQHLVFDLQAKSYWIEIEARPFSEPDVFSPLGGAWEEEKLFEGVDFDSLQGLESDPNGASRRFLEFLPDGTTTDATLGLSNDRGDRVTIKVVGATSRISIESPKPE